MAFPLRLTAAIRPFLKTAKVISPTSIAVFLSVGAHAVLLAFGPRTDFSFAALSQAAQEADAEETIVPLVELTPAEQNRLPSFAQPRQQPPSTADFGNLSLPSGLPFVPNTSIPKARRVPTNPFPNATRTQRTIQPRTQLPRPLPFPTLSLPSSITRPRPPELSVLPTPSTIPLPSDSEATGADSEQDSDATSTGSATDLLPQLEANPSIGEAIARFERARSAGVPDIGDRLATNPSASEQVDADVSVNDPPVDSANDPVRAPEEIAIAPAQGNVERLLDSYTYDNADTSADAAEANAAEWLASSASDKQDIVTDSAALTIDSEFKACLNENPPVDGLIGVVVNPDGTQEDLAVLKSTGYDLLNRQAIDAVERNNFGDSAVPVQYQVEIAVTYDPSNCVESLPTETGD